MYLKILTKITKNVVQIFYFLVDSPTYFLKKKFVYLNLNK